MRGTRPGLLRHVVKVGIIPAHAGNTKLKSSVNYPARDHPRACGEHYGAVVAKVTTSGSSPRMRGTHASVAYGRPPCGIIPAHAGNTTYRLARVRVKGDHPRACGEHRIVQIFNFFKWGSSPRMRGTRVRRAENAKHGGIIPAHAGNTRLSSKKGYPSGDHPRACGEHSLHDAYIGGFMGIIPAHAGNTVKVSMSHHQESDHPRACGEHTYAEMA